MKESKDTVCAIVVTYNRKRLLLECLEALKKQTRPIQGIYLIDNASTDGTPEFLLEKGYIQELPPKELKEPWEKEFEIKNLTDGQPIKLHYVRMHENTGGAGGFHEGVKKAYGTGYDWLWLMDDDERCDVCAVEYLCDHKDHYFALAPVVKLPDGTVQESHRGRIYYVASGIHIEPLKREGYVGDCIEINFSSFVGLMVNSKLIERIGFPNKKFFIYHDDVEFCLRIKSFTNENILLVPKSIIYHKEKPKFSRHVKFLFFESKRFPVERLHSLYYSIRNLTWIEKSYARNKNIFYIKKTFNFIKSICGIVLFDDYKAIRLKTIIRAYVDGIFNTYTDVIKSE